MKKIEALFVSAILVVSAGAFFLDSSLGPSSSRSTSGASEFISTGWYCPSPNAEGVDSFTSVANLGSRRLTLRRLAVGGSVESAVAVTELPAGRAFIGSVGEFNIAGAVSVNETFGAATHTDMLVTAKEAGAAASRCSVQPGDRWLFPIAGTVRRQDFSLLIANPFQEEAVIRVRVIAPDKDSVPARLKDVVIPPLDQSQISLSEFIPETASFGVEVSATQGRVIASRFAKFATREGVRGVSLDIGARDPSTQWLFAGAEVPTDGEESIVIINPGDREALVAVTLATETEQIAPPAVEELPIPPGRQVVVKSRDFSGPGVKHSLRVTSLNSVPIVAERQRVAAISGGRGFETVFGSPRGARRWVLGVGSPSGGSESLAIMNTGRRPVKVRISLLNDKAKVRPPELASIRIGAERRATVDLTGLLSGATAAALVETDSGEIVVERQLTIGPPFADFAFSPGSPLD